ncbi:restriction endonuclease [Fibrobacter sp. UWB4]|uniref:Eco29kI family restriction endonuclease n=1 Tax=Fibrobacter sp. UWB4 TaxID=1964356 RepID=UPI000B5286E1|nr:Eco29kI family restriction endonuclease [Fibrobacter sp. UWB4]OWV20279.1 restriction endonuclease [Fibrobacter sp. UWB4]
MQESKIFNPLDKENLGKSVSSAILSQPVYSLSDLKEFVGAGVYAIYYKGSFPLYKKLSKKNQSEYLWPIYAGKAVPQGARKGNLVLDSLSGKDLFKRLNEHRKSIEASENLEIKDFYCRYLIVDDIWIPLGESVLIQQTKPLWNNVIDGFGNHDPGSGRGKQLRSPWDMLHPGREWAKKLPVGKSVSEIEQSVNDFFNANF